MGERASASGIARTDFRWYLVGQAVSTFGSSCTGFILPLLAFNLTGSATALGVATVCVYLPYALVGLPIGALADRWDRRTVLIASDLGRAVVIGLVPLLQALGRLNFSAILLVILAHSTLRIFFEAAQFAVLPSLVAKEQLTAANGRAQAAYNSAAVFGPVIAGVLLVRLHPADVLWVDILSFLFSAGCITRIATDLTGTPGPRRRLRREIREGLNLVFSNPLLRNITIVAILVNVFTGPYWAESIYVAKVRIGASDSEIGLMFAASGLGVVVAGLLAGRVSKRFSFGQVTCSALVLLGVSIVGFCLTTSLVVAIAFAGLARAGAVTFGVSTSSLRQRVVPRHLLGRIMTIALVCAWTAQPVGAAAATGLIALFDSPATIVGVGGLLVVVTGIAATRSVLTRRDAEAESRAAVEKALE